MRFSTFINKDGDYFDVLHFTKVVDKYPIHELVVYAYYCKTIA